MSNEISQLGADENHPIGRFEAGLRDTFYDGLIRSFDSNEGDVEQGTYRVTFADGTGGEVQFDFTEFDERGEQTMPCGWLQWNRARRVTDQGPQGQLGTWRDAVTWLRQTAQAAAIRSESRPTGIS